MTSCDRGDVIRRHAERVMASDFGRQMGQRPTPDPVDTLLVEQIAYYRAIAAEYEDHALREPGGDELLAALDSFEPTGRVLELACGSGLWTIELLRHAKTITAVDASSEMLAIASVRARDPRVRFVRADIFDWTPEERYDVVFFSFWLSHVPLERFESVLVGRRRLPRAHGTRLLRRRRVPDAR